MLETDIPVILHITAQCLFVISTIVFAISACDDLFLDGWYYFRHFNKNWHKKKESLPPSLEILENNQEQFLALMLPAWQESDVIYGAVKNLLQTNVYKNYYIFIGVYPNDSETTKQALKLADEFNKVRVVITNLPGPTCKADCLNNIIQEIYSFEKRHKIQFQAVIMQDAEDVVHPLSLKLFNYFLPKFDLIQIPVFSLPRKWNEITGGHYMDEFAESHSKELHARELFSGIVPGAGVGTAYSRRALKFAEENQGEIFSIESLTEDYEFSFRMREAGLRQIFVKYTFLELNNADLKIVATRELFPNKFWPSVRQKTRWTIGIMLQSWESFGWHGNWRVKYLFWRDRKPLFFSHAIMLGYSSILIFVGLYFYRQHYMPDYYLPPLLETSNFLWNLVYFNVFMVVYRLINRHIFTYRLYGFSYLPMVTFRYIWGATINYFAICRAIKIYFTHRFMNKKIGWDKTDHEIPDEIRQLNEPLVHTG